MVPLLPVDKTVGGLVVIPDSHLPEAQARIKERCPQLEFTDDWCPLSQFFLYKESDELLIEAEPGDLILWDSRTVLGGRVGTGQFQQGKVGNDGDLVRLSVTVAMTQRSRASDECLAERRRGFEKRVCFNYTPHATSLAPGRSRRRDEILSLMD